MSPWRLGALACLSLLAGCGPAPRRALVPGPPPEYEPPRQYDPQGRNIDELGSEQSAGPAEPAARAGPKPDAAPPGPVGGATARPGQPEHAEPVEPGPRAPAPQVTASPPLTPPAGPAPIPPPTAPGEPARIPPPAQPLQ
ncbi:MAG: hypothetical protein HY744_16375 [Deltaproteobacteria bacterium]|nr:hypothetical protein [Deltaproteobacteria bacterium]